MMEDKEKTHKELLVEVEELRRRITELEAREEWVKQAKTFLRDTEEKYRAILENIEDGYYEVDLAGKYIFCNKAYSKIMGVPMEEIIGQTYKNVGSQRAQSIYDTFHTVYLTGIPTETVEGKVVRKNGSQGDIEYSVSLIRDENGLPIGFRGITRDITERKRTEAEIAEWRQRYELTIASSGQVVYDYHIETNSILWGGSVDQVLGYQLQEMSGGGDQYVSLLHREDRKETLRLFKIAQQNNTPYVVEYRFKHKSGDYLWIHDRGFFITDTEGKAVRMLGMMQDITERKRMEEALRTLSLVDDLTGLYNRRGFLTLAEQELKIANRMNRGMFLLFVDLDYLKEINDSYGHKEGDQSLIAVANVIKDTYRTPDIIARIGGG